MDGMRAVPSPSVSNLPTFFRWCLGGMSAFASGSAPARDADAAVSGLEYWESLNADCGDMPASQDDLLASGGFLGGDGDSEVFSTPPLTQQDSQSQRGQAGDGEEGITMCSMPFTQTPPSSPSPASSPERVPSKPRKPRICTRKVRVRRGAKIRTPTPSPTRTPTPTPERDPKPTPELDPLVRLVLMVPTAPLPTTDDDGLLELGRRLGIF